MELVYIIFWVFAYWKLWLVMEGEYIYETGIYNIYMLYIPLPYYGQVHIISYIVLDVLYRFEIECILLLRGHLCRSKLFRQKLFKLFIFDLSLTSDVLPWTYFKKIDDWLLFLKVEIRIIYIHLNAALKQKGV